MKYLLRILFCLAAGMALMMLIALIVFFSFTKPNDSEKFVTSKALPAWYVLVQASPGNSVITVLPLFPHKPPGWGIAAICEELPSGRLDDLSVLAQRPDAASQASYVLQQRRTGWPFYAFAGSRHGTVIADEQMLTQGLDSALEISNLPAGFAYGNNVLPMQPIWTGLIGNVALYAALVGSAWFAARVQVQRGRRKKGQCVVCGYVLKSSQVCPECGARDASRTVRSDNREENGTVPITPPIEKRSQMPKHHLCLVAALFSSIVAAVRVARSHLASNRSQEAGEVRSIRQLSEDRSYRVSFWTDDSTSKSTVRRQSIAVVVDSDLENVLSVALSR